MRSSIYQNKYTKDLYVVINDNAKNIDSVVERTTHVIIYQPLDKNTWIGETWLVMNKQRFLEEFIPMNKIRFLETYRY